MSIVERFFTELDARWKSRGAERLRLRLIGSTALMLQTDYARGTKDSDVLESDQLLGDNGQRLLALAGCGTIMHRRHGLYLDVVSRGLPFLPQAPLWHAVTSLNTTLTHVEIQVLDVVDVVVSKLKRFSASDLSDIEAMVERGRIPPGILLDRFRSAVRWYCIDARALDLPKYVRNLNRIERDLLLVGESTIDLPDWILPADG